MNEDIILKEIRISRYETSYSKYRCTVEVEGEIIAGYGYILPTAFADMYANLVNKYPEFSLPKKEDNKLLDNIQ